MQSPYTTENQRITGEPNILRQYIDHNSKFLCVCRIWERIRMLACCSVDVAKCCTMLQNVAKSVSEIVSKKYEAKDKTIL